MVFILSYKMMFLFFWKIVFYLFCFCISKLSQSISRVLSLDKFNYPMDGHLSSIYVTKNIKQPTHSSINANYISEPIRSCTGWGLQIF